MIRINLLPHREQKRRERRTQFYVMSLLMIGLGLAIGYVVHTMIAGQIEQQEARNSVYKNDIAKLDKEIAEIRTLQQQIDDLLARKQVIESLQGNRAETVHLLNQLVLSMPEGVYLKSLKQTGRVVKLGGLAQSNSRVSHLMRNLDQSPLLDLPKLIEVKATSVNNRRLSEFVMDISIARPTAEELEATRK
jgi:type IV pilus assembly protein PilN